MTNPKFTNSTPALSGIGIVLFSLAPGMHGLTGYWVSPDARGNRSFGKHWADFARGLAKTAKAFPFSSKVWQPSKRRQALLLLDLSNRWASGSLGLPKAILISKLFADFLASVSVPSIENATLLGVQRAPGNNAAASARP